MDPLAVLAYGAEQSPPLIGMEWKLRALPNHLCSLIFSN